MMECKVCNRMHELNQPCPRRIANAYMMQPQALEQLTAVDKEWMTVYGGNFSVLDIVEDAIANMI